MYSFICQLTLFSYFVGYSFGTVELSVIVTKMSRYIESNGGFRYISIKHYFGDLGRAALPDLLTKSDLDTAICNRWPQSMLFECREI